MIKKLKLENSMYGKISKYDKHFTITNFLMLHIVSLLKW